MVTLWRIKSAFNMCGVHVKNVHHFNDVLMLSNRYYLLVHLVVHYCNTIYYLSYTKQKVNKGD